MGILGRLILVVILIAGGVGAAGYYTLESGHKKLMEDEALRIAEIIATQVETDRAVYTQMLVTKLVNDGKGASQHSEAQPGYIPLPAQFIREVAQRITAHGNKLYSYSLMSHWNINPKQALKDDFDTWAWDELLKQDQEFKAAASTGTPALGHSWKPVYRIGEIGGKPIMRLMRADPASSQACVTCHNALEQSPEIMATRTAAGKEVGKQWKLHELIGALRVDVQLEQVEALARQSRNEMVMNLLGVFLIGFILLYALIRTGVLRPVVASVVEIDGFTNKIDSVVLSSQKLLIGAEDQMKACQKAAESLGGVDTSKAERQVLQGLQSQANENAKSAEEAAYVCSELEDSFGALKRRLLKMIGRQ